ncbi:hypothetical protein LSH36_324g03073 [Paralvinella palmiformis]|uniref:Uncharacterized protein n=1 Tax=Paralvinella palmiformis TaxID=53620 RepID=A0AAD9N0V9_9ANNE|nr:hypothetical protein LSH36_324g03073 [Paralvinella palmiformis]
MSPHPRKLAYLSYNSVHTLSTTKSISNNENAEQVHVGAIRSQAPLNQSKSIRSLTSNDSFSSISLSHIVSQYLSRAQQDNGTQLIQRLQLQKGYFRMLLAIYLLYFIFMTPYYIFYMAMSTRGKYHLNLPHWIPVTLEWMADFPPLIKLFVYIMLCKDFKEGMARNCTYKRK